MMPANLSERETTIEDEGVWRTLSDLMVLEGIHIEVQGVT